MCPSCSTSHWVIPLHKRKAVWQPNNYRGIHLTAQLAKATERLLQLSFKAHLGSKENTYKNQFAYKYDRRARLSLLDADLDRELLQKSALRGILLGRFRRLRQDTLRKTTGQTESKGCIGTLERTFCFLITRKTCTCSCQR